LIKDILYKINNDKSLQCDAGFVTRAQICKRLRSSGIDSTESIPPTYVVWRVVVPDRETTWAGGIDSFESNLGLLKRLQIRTLVGTKGNLQKH
jgi:hypothetical protein